MLLFSTMSAFASNHTTMDSLKNAMNALMHTLQAEESYYSSNPKKLRETITPVITEHFDMLTISRWALGKNWRKMSRNQRSRFLGLFKRLLLKVYGNVLILNLDKEIKWSLVREADDGSSTVVRAIVEGDAGVAKIDFYMKKKPKLYEGIKIYDVKVNGVSLVTNYRSSFSNIITRDGVEGFLKQLEKKSG